MPITSTSTTNASNLQRQIYSKLSRDSTQANIEWGNLFDRSFEKEAKGEPYERILIHGVDRFQAETVAQTANALAAGGSLTFDAAAILARVSLIVDTHAYQAFDLEWELEHTSSIPLMEKLANMSGYAVSHRVDDDCAGLADDFSQAVGTLATSLTDAQIRRAIQYLNDAFAPEGDRVFVFSPAQQLDLLAVDKYINSLYKGSVGNMSAGPKYKGYQGSAYGLDWYMSQNVEGTNAAGHDNAIFQREAVALVVFDNMRTATHYETGTDSNRFAVHAMYGVVEVRDDHGVFCRGL